MRQKTFLPLQSEPAECGVVAIAALTASLGVPLCPQEIKKKYGLSTRGLSISQLLTMLREAGFTAHAAIVEKNRPDAICVPAIVLWKDKHFVVVREVNKKYCDIFDPERGWLTVARDEFETGLSGFVVEVTNTPSVPTIGLRKPIEIMKWLRHFNIRKPLTKVALWALLAQATILFLPLLSKHLIDANLTPNTSDLAYWVLGAYAAVGALGIILSSLTARLVANVASRLTVELTSDVVKRLLAKPLEFLARNVPTVLLGKVQSVQIIQLMLLQSASSTIITGGIGALAIFALFWISPLFASGLIVLRLISFFIDKPLRQEVAHDTEKRHRAYVKQMSVVIETIKAVAPLRAVRSIGKSIDKIDKETNELAVTTMRLNKSEQARTDMRATISLLDQLFYLGLGSSLVATNKISFGAFVALGLYRQYVSAGFAEMQDFASTILNVRTATSRLEGIVDPDLATPQHEQSKPIQLDDASIRFDKVMFRYSAFDEPVMSDFDMTIAEGECVAIVGPSGSGKSTIAKLCTGGLKPTRGSIFVGGIEFDEKNEDGLLAHIGTVMQADHLITDSIFENISFHRDLSQTVVEEAAKLACIDEFIVGLPMRYHTVISDEYSALSGGQRQRILLARAIAATPRILVMDEATSALDAETELKIANNIRSMTMTRIIFAHRTETIRIADRIITIGQ